MKRLLVVAVLLMGFAAWGQEEMICLGEDSSGNLRKNLVDSSGRAVVTGALTSNNAAPGATNTGCLGAVANAAAPSYTEGMQVLQSVDLSGNTRITGTVSGSGTFTVAGAKTNDNAAPGATNVGALACVANAAAPSWTEGNLVACSVDLAGNQRVNVAQMNGVATSMGNGVSGTGVQRVTVASDSTGTSICTQATAASLKTEAVGTKTTNAAVPGATNMGALTAVANAAAPTLTETYLAALSVDLAGNLRTNTAQINGVTTLMGNGVTGTGSQRVTVASDNTSFSVGTKTNNNAAPGATNVGALGAVANAAAPSWTEGNLVAASVDLSGAQRANLSTLIAGENLAGTLGSISTWMEVYKAGTYTSAPAATTTTVPLNATPCTAVGGASCTIIYASTDWGAWPNLTISLRNSSANVLENVLIEWSPDGTNFELWDSTSFANLAATTTISLAISGNSRRWLRLEARSDDAVVSAVVTITANQN